MESKILFTDLDGTLLNSQKKISQHVYDKIQEMTAAGHKFVLASGRSLENIITVKNELCLTQEGVYITAYNGAAVYDCTADKLLVENRLPLGLACDIYEAAKKAGIYCQTYTDTHILAPVHSKELDFYNINVKQPYYLAEHLPDYLTAGPHKLIAINLDDKQKLENFRDTMMATHHDSIATSFSNAYYLEFYSPKAGKGNGLLALCNALGIPVSRSYAMGDEENDISMIQAAGTGIAMQNATDATKATADYITMADNDHDGIAEVIDHFILA